MAAQGVLAGRRTKQRDRLALGEEAGQLGDQLLRPLLLHLFEVAPAILVPGDFFLARLAVEVGVQFLARSEFLVPALPVFVLLRQGSRTIAADQQTQAVVRLDRVVPALGLDRHEGAPSAGARGLL